MTSLQDLVAQKAAVEKAIADHKPAAVQQVKQLMQVLGVTAEDLGLAPIAKNKRPVKYRDANGNTWTGVGQRPRWLQARVLAGATLEEFRVPK